MRLVPVPFLDHQRIKSINIHKSGHFCAHNAIFYSPRGAEGPPAFLLGTLLADYTKSCVVGIGTSCGHAAHFVFSGAS